MGPGPTDRAGYIELRLARFEQAVVEDLRLATPESRAKRTAAREAYLRACVWPEPSRPPPPRSSSGSTPALTFSGCLLQALVIIGLGAVGLTGVIAMLWILTHLLAMPTPIDFDIKRFRVLVDRCLVSPSSDEQRELTDFLYQHADTLLEFAEQHSELTKHQHLVEALQWMPVGTVVDFCDLDDFLEELRADGWRPRDECSHKFIGPDICVHCHCSKEEVSEIDAERAKKESPEPRLPGETK